MISDILETVRPDTVSKSDTSESRMGSRSGRFPLMAKTVCIPSHRPVVCSMGTATRHKRGSCGSPSGSLTKISATFQRFWRKATQANKRRENLVPRLSGSGTKHVMISWNLRLLRVRLITGYLTDCFKNLLKKIG